MRKKGRYTLLDLYVGREYVLSFFVSFAFFFFIFFINQILVLAQKIIIKNVSISDMISLVVLYIPQFLMYTMPFSSLTSASMVIGSLSSQNEILAMRSSGINTRRIFRPILVISIVLSAITFLIADFFIPYTAKQYRMLYGQILQKIPTVELQSYSSARFGDRVISNGAVEDNVLHDVLIFDDTDRNDSRVISADRAQISIVDLDRFIYRVDLDNPRILITDADSQQTYSLSSAKHMTLFLNLSSSASGYSPITPSQMSIRELSGVIAERREEDRQIKIRHGEQVSSSADNLADALVKVENAESVTTDDILHISNLLESYEKDNNYRAFSFYYQYYRSEFNKKLALSAACTFLVLIAFPLSFVRMKYGRLTGFGLSMFAACIYWFLLYFLHTRAIVSPLNPALFLWAPNFIVLIVSLLLQRRTSKS